MLAQVLFLLQALASSCQCGQVCALLAGRECVAPELNRNSNIGETGANMNKSMFRRFLRSMAWATEVRARWLLLDC